MDRKGLGSAIMPAPLTDDQFLGDNGAVTVTSVVPAAQPAPAPAAVPVAPAAVPVAPAPATAPASKELSDDQFLGPQAAAPPPAPAAPTGPVPDTLSNLAAGFGHGFMRPIDNLATWASMTPPGQLLDKAAPFLGMPTTAQANANQASQLDAFTAAGGKPSGLADFAGGVLRPSRWRSRPRTRLSAAHWWVGRPQPIRPIPAPC